MPGAVLQMWERQVQNLVMCSCQEHPKSPRKAAAQPLGQQMQRWRTWTRPEMHVASPGQPELGFVPRLSDGDTTGENPPPCALSLEAINKSTPRFGGPSADPATQQSWVPQSPAAVPELSSTPALAAASPSCSIPAGMKATGT